MKDPVPIARPTCGIEGCEQNVGFTHSWCSPQHRRAGLRYAEERLRAHIEGDEVPEPPTAAELEERRARAQRWTADRMQERINQLRRGDL